MNEVERVYCHGCGAKLDRTVILATQEKQTVSREQRQREVKKLMTPGNGWFLKTLAMLIKTVALAGLAAVVIQIIRPPEGVPPLPKKGEVLTLPQIGDDLERLTAAPAGQGMIFREADINTYLQKKTFRKVPSWFTNIIPLKRSFVNFEPGQARLSVQADLAGYPVYAGITARLVGDPKTGLSATCVSLNLGRLTLHAPAVAQVVAVAVPTLMDSVKRDRQLLEQLGSAEITKGQIILRSRGPQAAPAASVVPNAAAGRPAGH